MDETRITRSNLIGVLDFYLQVYICMMVANLLPVGNMQ